MMRSAPNSTKTASEMKVTPPITVENEPSALTKLANSPMQAMMGSMINARTAAMHQVSASDVPAQDRQDGRLRADRANSLRVAAPEAHALPVSPEAVNRRM